MVNVTYNTTLKDYNATSVSDLFTYMDVVVNGFWSMILVGLFFIITMGTYNAQMSRTGRGDILSSLTVAAWFTTVISFVMSLIPGMISTTPILFSLTGSILFTIVLFLTNRTEQ